MRYVKTLLTGRRLLPLPFVQCEYRLDSHIEHPRQFERHGKTRIVLIFLNSVDRLARNAKSICQL